MNISNRLEKLRLLLIEKELDGIFISQPDNRFYLSGFNGSAGYLLITKEAAVLATDFRYIEQVKEQAPAFRLSQITGASAEWFPGLVGELGVSRLGFESANITFAAHGKLAGALENAGSKTELVPVEDLVETMRAVKEPGEIELISRAAEITDRAFAHIQDFIKPGMTELEVAWELEQFQREHGSQEMPFEIIVASGPAAALPHHRPDNRKISSGDAVVIDMGAKVQGYTSDFTRTLRPGTPDETFKKVYDIVLGAQLTAISLIKPGMTGEEADAFARTVIEEAGYGEQFGHSLGHGVGLVTHEQPRLGPNSADKLLPGMVFSVEPGIYLPGWGGARIEDLAVMEENGIRTLSKGEK